VKLKCAAAPAIVLGEQIIEAGGRHEPFAFEIPYNPARLSVRMPLSTETCQKLMAEIKAQ